MVLFAHNCDADYARPLPDRRCRLLEYFPICPVWTVAAEIRLLEIRGTRSPNDGIANGRLKDEPSPDVDRRCRSSSEMVFRIEGRAPGGQAHRRRNETSYERAGNVEVEKLKKQWLVIRG